MVVDGFTSHEAPVLSGVPQGTVVGPLLFLVTDVSSLIRLFADDCLLYREVRSLSDFDLLQWDIDRLVQWSKMWGMEFYCEEI